MKPVLVSPIHTEIVGITVPIPIPNNTMEIEINQLKGTCEIKMNPADYNNRAIITIELKDNLDFIFP